MYNCVKTGGKKLGVFLNRCRESALTTHKQYQSPFIEMLAPLFFKRKVEIAFWKKKTNHKTKPNKLQRNSWENFKYCFETSTHNSILRRENQFFKSLHFFLTFAKKYFL